MPIIITYLDSKEEIQFSCPSRECPVRERLIANLTEADVTFRNTGTDIWVKSEEFSSTDDIAEQALAGFSEIEDLEGYDHYDPTGNVMTFRYNSIIPAAKIQEASALYESTQDVFNSQIEALKENSKDLLDAHYNGLRPSLDR